jgi:hypothetical protein
LKKKKLLHVHTTRRGTKNIHIQFLVNFGYKIEIVQVKKMETNLKFLKNANFCSHRKSPKGLLQEILSKDNNIEATHNFDLST